MARAKKDGENVSFYIERDIMNRLREYADSKGQTITKALEILLRKALDEAETSDHLTGGGN